MQGSHLARTSSDVGTPRRGCPRHTLRLVPVLALLGVSLYVLLGLSGPNDPHGQLLLDSAQLFWRKGREATKEQGWELETCRNSVSNGYWRHGEQQCKPIPTVPAPDPGVVAHCAPLLLKWPNGTIATRGGSLQTWVWETLVGATTDDGHRRCERVHVSSAIAREVLGERWVAVLGDSEARKFAVALLNHMAPTMPVVFNRHSDFMYDSSNAPIPAIVSFTWAPYTENITSTLEAWDARDTLPDYLVLSAGLWHMLWSGHVDEYALEASRLHSVLMPRINRKAKGFWISLSSLIHHKLLSEQKRQMMNNSQVQSYNGAVSWAGLLAPRGPLILLDLHSVSQGCGDECTTDGIHYSENVYQVLVQAFLNALAF